MALIRHKVLEAEVDESGCIDIPKGSTVAGVNFRFPSGKPYLIFVMEYNDWAKEFPDEAKKEEEDKRAKAEQEGSPDVK